MAQAFNIARREVVRRSNIIQQPGNYMENIDNKWRSPFSDDLDHMHAMPAGVLRVLLWDIWTDLLTMIHGPCGWSIQYPPPIHFVSGGRRPAPTQDLQSQPPVSADEKDRPAKFSNNEDAIRVNEERDVQENIGGILDAYTEGDDFQGGDFQGGEFEDEEIEVQDEMTKGSTQGNTMAPQQLASDHQASSGVNAESQSGADQGFTGHYGFGAERTVDIGMRGHDEGLEELEDFFREQDQQARYQGW